MKSPAPSSKKADGDAKLGPFYDPLEGWANDDILLSQRARDALAAAHPAALRVLDWPELREFFSSHDLHANSQRARDNKLGLASVAFEAAGLILAAFAPLSIGQGRVIGIAATCSMVLGAAMAVFHWISSRSKSRWLGSRFCTERARQLYFQALINNLPLVAEAMCDDAALEAWHGARANSLSALQNGQDVPAQIRRLVNDVAEGEPWVLPTWHAAPTAILKSSKETNLLLSLLRSQRFDIQAEYSERKLADTLMAPRRRSQTIRVSSDIFTFIAIVCAAVSGVLLSSNRGTQDPVVKLTLALAATASALVLALRAVNDGMLLSGDAARYGWYNAAVLRTRTQFDGCALDEKVDVLRHMEVLSYRELQSFLRDHWRARYIL